ncbi:MlaD family protein [Corallincola platygyrae]|uniref:MlaD family protein n=1 Tax=Corallincola platygyrae TaxID=1193278 RepID=A0ABW4XRB3_9GAMM
MGQNANAAKIGLFVVTALALLVAGIIMFSSDRLFRTYERYLVVFPGSVQGLVKGSPVSFQGVTIGEVVDVRIHYATKTRQILVPVLVDVNSDLLNEFFEGVADKDMERATQGLRAKLVPQSLVTGRLMVQIEFEPMQSGELHPSNLKYPQIPTMPSALEVVGQAFSSTMEKVAKLPLEDIANNLNAILEQTRQLTESQGVKESLADLHHASRELNVLLAQLNRDMPALTTQLSGTLSTFEQTAKDVSGLSKSAEGLVAEGQKTIAQSTETLAKVDATLAQAEATLLTYQSLADHDSQLKHSAEQSLQQLNATLKSARTLIDTLQRRPESVVFGK